MTIELIAIITGSCVGTMVCDGRCRSPMLGGISLLTLLVYVQYHQYSKFVQCLAYVTDTCIQGHKRGASGTHSYPAAG